MVENCRRDITIGKYVKSINDIFADNDLIENNKNVLFKMLNFPENTDNNKCYSLTNFNKSKLSI